MKYMAVLKQFQERRRLIKRMAAKGRSQSSIAAELKISRQRVSKILKSMEAENAN
jgi:DNA-binding MarR family transcriptional regulator